MTEIRRYRAQDRDATFAIFVDAVHNGTGEHYTKEEQTAWMPVTETPQGWDARLADHITYVAAQGETLVGFMTMGRDGHIDLAYVAALHARKGIGGALYAQLLADARKLGLAVLDTEASHLAKGFFLRHGWEIEARQSVIRQGVAITNFRMFARL